jgi:predicted nucleic acid-binding Zn ribbon protein
MIKCPKCTTVNNTQKFCGNCGTKLLQDGVELTEETTIIEKEKKDDRRWWKAFFLFLAFWIVGGNIVSIVIALLGYGRDSEKVGVIICVVLGIFVAMQFLKGKREKDKEELKDFYF